MSTRGPRYDEPREASLLEKLHAYLAEPGREGGASADELLALVLPGRGDDAVFGRTFLAGLVASDPRFEQEPTSGRWRLAEENLLDAPIHEAAFVVVDLETTGQRPEHAAITEIGAVRLQADCESARFESLLRPSTPIPPYVAKLTGIDDAMVADAPPLADVLPGFAEFAADAVIVAHNAAFDVTLLDDASREILDRPLGLPSLCTLKLARRLIPALEKASLDSLAEHFELSQTARHRAMSDAELTAAILTRLLDMARARGASTVGDLLALQEETGTRPFVAINVSRQTLERLPEGPGVYWLLDEDGVALYVGSASNVRERVVSYYLTTAHLSERQRDMVSATVDVGVRATTSEVDMLIAEAEEVRRFKPTHNRSARHLPRGCFIKVSKRARFARVLVSSRIAGDGALYLGPIRGRAFAEQAAAMLARLYQLRTCSGHLTPDPEAAGCELGPAGFCTSPCNGGVDEAAYREQVRQLERDLSGDGSALRAMVARSASDDGGTAKADAGLLARLARLNRKRHWLVNCHNYLAAFPAADQGLLLVLVLDGYCRRVARVSDSAALAELVAAATRPGRHPNAHVPAYYADVSTIMAHLVRRSANDGEALVVDLEPEDIAASLEAAAAELEPLVDSLG